MPVGHLHVPFGEMSIQIFCPFLNQHCFFFFTGFCVCVCVLSCNSCLPMLGINPLSALSIANIFSHSVGLSFCFVYNSMDCIVHWVAKSWTRLSDFHFVVQKHSGLIRSHLFIVTFISLALGDKSPQNIARIYVKECSAYIFLYGFYVFWSHI